MDLNKFKIPIILMAAVMIFIFGTFFGLKIARKIEHHFVNMPQLFGTKGIINRLNISSIQGGVRIFTASSLDRVFQDGKTLQKPSFSRDVSISSAKNAYESFQIVVDSPQNDEPGVYLQTSDFVNSKTGKKISKDNFQWRVVGYVWTKPPYYPVKFVGFWPDPLIPALSCDIKAGTVQPFWMTVYVPPNTPAGDYNATVIVKGLNFPAQTIPVKLHVYDFALPKKSHLKTAFDFYAGETHIRYPKGKDETTESYKARLDKINDEFIVNMIKHRMDPILNVDLSSQTELSDLERYIPLGLNNFAIGKHGGTFNNNWPEDDPSIDKLQITYQTYGEILKEDNLLNDAYLYTWDESNMGSPLISKVAAMVHRAYPGLKNMVCYHGFWDPDQYPGWGKDIDIWTFQIDDFNEAKMRRLQKMGMEMWMYVSGPAGTTSPNLAMDFDSIGYRIIPWMCWKYDIRGFLYWEVNWWPQPDVNPFLNAHNSKWEQNGNGLLFYPGTDGPWDSVRTENFRDGMQDYEYIQLLLNNLRLMRAKGFEAKYKQDFDQSIKLLTMDDSIVKDVWNFTKDGNYLMSRRNAIALEIEKLNTFLKTP